MREKNLKQWKIGKPRWLQKNLLLATLFIFNFSVLASAENEGSRAEIVAQQQKTTITGTVTDTKGESLPGVSVVVKGTTQGVITDINGVYSISVSGPQTLVFSFVGMKIQEILLAKQTVVDVVLEADAIGLNEVVAIGYGSKKRAS